ncbi:type I restriction enzyme HsdR N-terminal domain-containing protein [Virgibacillus necropolis]|uniref:type I restriction endonuclease n=1 Tax=Virgibacillus necropolis TaxID=163877 RepID=UPI00384A4D26
MDKFIEQVNVLSKRVSDIKGNIATEEATKTSVIMPFFQTLGYDIFNPSEFTPEFTADVGLKKGEKVDYAIMHEGQPVILVEAKSISENLTKHDSQLFRYFGTTTAKFAILTNGVIYRFYTDLEEQNKMDTDPFFEFNLLNIKENQLQELYKFRKDSFDLDKIFDTASDLKYVNKAKEFLNQQWSNPTDDFVWYITGQIYEGKRTKHLLGKFEPIIKKTFKQFVNEMVNEKLNAALKTTNIENEEKETVEEPIIEPKELIVTTEEEIEGYSIVKVILHDVIDLNRVQYRDNKSYFNILLDNSIRKWIVRLGLSKSNKYIKFNDEDRTTVNIDSVTDILKHSDQIKKIAEKYI